MALGGFLILGVLQLIIALVAATAFVPYKLPKPQKQNYQHFVKALVTVGVICCFRFVASEDTIDIFPDAGFAEYQMLVFISFCFLWLVKIPVLIKRPWLLLPIQWMLGISFWLSLLTCIKFVPMIPMMLFPLLGTLVMVPYFVFAISLFEIDNLARQKGKMIWFHSIVSSALLLIVFQLLMNLWSESSWELIRLFSLHYNLINWD